MKHSSSKVFVIVSILAVLVSACGASTGMPVAAPVSADVQNVPISDSQVVTPPQGNCPAENEVVQGPNFYAACVMVSGQLTWRSATLTPGNNFVIEGTPDNATPIPPLPVQTAPDGAALSQPTSCKDANGGLAWAFGNTDWSTIFAGSAAGTLYFVTSSSELVTAEAAGYTGVQLFTAAAGPYILIGALSVGTLIWVAKYAEVKQYDVTAIAKPVAPMDLGMEPINWDIVDGPTVWEEWIAGHMDSTDHWEAEEVIADVYGQSQNKKLSNRGNGTNDGRVEIRAGFCQSGGVNILIAHIKNNTLNYVAFFVPKNKLSVNPLDGASFILGDKYIAAADMKMVAAWKMASETGHGDMSAYYVDAGTGWNMYEARAARCNATVIGEIPLP